MSRPTLKDVAAKAGVSYQTVSKVLNRRAQVSPQTEERIWKAVHELNYRPNVVAQNLRQQASRLIGYAWGVGGPQVWRPINNRFLHSVVYACEERGYLITFFTNNEDAYSDISAYEELYGRRQVDGFILENTIDDDPRIRYLIKAKIPFVAFGRTQTEQNFCWVDVDGHDGIFKVVSHLLQRDHKRIALIGWARGATTGSDRESGYFSCLQQADITPNPDWIFRGDNEFATGAQGIAQFLQLADDQRPTAVVCLSDQIAVGAMNAALAAGLQIGQDIAITGYDDVNMAQFLQPPLTTVSQPIDEAGQHVTELLLAQINGTLTTHRQILLKPKLVLRASA